MNTSKTAVTFLAGTLTFCATALADPVSHGPGFDAPGIRADGHAPIGVMGDHMHKKGEWMLSYRFMSMTMDGNRIGDDGVSPETIATTAPNPFFGQPMQPPTLRVVPTDMTMDMHMFGAMYAPADWITLSAMVNYHEKEMDHVTFQGPAGTTRLGEFTTRSEGLGDTKLGALVALHGENGRNWHLNMGVSVPTGSITEKDTVLAPTGMMPTLRLPYPMQLGSGTYDLLPGITYSVERDRFGWGAQYMGTIRLGDNDEDYTLGDEHRATAWLSYLWKDAASTSLRVTAVTTDDIDGMDPNIVAPVQTADPSNHGGDRVNLGLGLNLVAQRGALRGHRVAAEFSVPVYEDLNGPQLETDWNLTVGWQFAF